MASLSEDPIREWITTEGKASVITRISPIGGGCINFANRYDTDVGSFFVKTNRHVSALFIISFPFSWILLTNFEI